MQRMMTRSFFNMPRIDPGLPIHWASYLCALDAQPLHRPELHLGSLRKSDIRGLVGSLRQVARIASGAGR